MAYALVAWRRDGDDEPVHQAMTDLPATHFFRGLCLVREDGVAWSDVKERIQDIVEAHPGTQAVITVPAKGTRVGGWVDTAPPPDALKEAREIMNRSGSNAVPVLFATPDTDDGGG